MARASCSAMRCDTVDSEPLMTEPVVPNEMAKTLGVTGLRLRSWLRAEKHAGHPLLADHQHRGRFCTSLRDADVVPIGAGFDDDRAFVAGLGFTDVVKRATARETGLRPGELQHGRALLETRLADIGVSRIIFTFKKAATALV